MGAICVQHTGTDRRYTPQITTRPRELGIYRRSWLARCAHCALLRLIDAHPRGSRDHCRGPNAHADTGRL